MQKYVASSTPLARRWTNAERIEGPVEDFVRELRAGDGGDIGVHGSIVLTQALLAAGLVDELRLVGGTRVVGRGGASSRTACPPLELVGAPAF